MRHLLPTFATACALLVPMTLPGTQAWAADTAAAPAATARVIVKFKSDSALLQRQAQSAPAAEIVGSRAHALGQRMGLTLRGGAPIAERTQVVLADGVNSAELAARLSRQGDVEYAVVDKRRRALAVPNDPLYTTVAGNGPATGQWYLRAPTSTVRSAINAEAAWDTTTGSSDIVVAVLDTGIRFDHADLVGRLHPGYDFIADVATSNDGNGRDTDPSDPGDWITDAENEQAGGEYEDCGASDSSWHGTQVAGIIGAATANGIGMASVGRNVMILPARVLGKCGGFDSDIIAAMRWSAGLSVPGVPANPHPARVINLSLGGDGTCDASTGYPDAISAINAAGVVIVTSAGNSAGHAVGVPANCSGVIAVGGLRHAGTKVGFSDLGPEVSLSAPGGNCVDIGPNDPCVYPLLTTTNAGTRGPVAGSSIYTDSFNISVGTSFSAPLVAGTAALMLSVRPDRTPAQVLNALRATARPFPTTGGDNGDGSEVPVCTAPRFDTNDDPIDQLQCYCTTATCGAGMLDAAAAVAAVTPAQAPTAPLTASTANPTVGSPVALDASLATVAAGRSGTFQWSIVDGADIAAFTSATNASLATLLPSASGTVTVELSVVDDLGAQTSAWTHISVSAAPSASITAPTSAVVGTDVTLDGSGSAATGGRSIVDYEWTITSGSSIASLTDADSETATLEIDEPGSVGVSLTVTDSAGVTTSVATTIVASATPQPSGGGGGALQLHWLLALAAAVGALGRAGRRPTGG
ncbi:S8 family peptidase [Piscinibacter sp.]|uniref:S8 family peptidase n=1 Tax=Piscinibacter sp. TaxID=1903157 RepID=UPI002BB9CA9C|nr:S8 family serine peptidase [Albitalea sp.]HUG21581.1 S8 family serine peptidase [Albitalea sp.]